MAQTTGGDVASEVRGSRTEVVHGSEQHTVHGDHMTVVMGQSVLRVEAEHAVVVGEGRDDGIVETNVSGKWIVSAGKTARIQADQGISLVVGTAWWRSSRIGSSCARAAWRSRGRRARP
ncbi:hypothetical protein [Polyangium mundeleinium]|uniref:DUF2345 domain-containing protein n=1 Tax=Polyangium mundeleinium TaxID=2995306 RepID=A0ABT5F3F7_9BACT|nr:hypothetical protein [Polyangium mundeleinium]MDC0748164.1 hypothetical protein [Polyangium mundeleinium]